jgi:hypothetical protein
VLPAGLRRELSGTLAVPVAIHSEWPRLQIGASMLSFIYHNNFNQLLEMYNKLKIIPLNDSKHLVLTLVNTI